MSVSTNPLVNPAPGPATTGADPNAMGLHQRQTAAESKSLVEQAEAPIGLDWFEEKAQEEAKTGVEEPDGGEEGAETPDSDEYTPEEIEQLINDLGLVPESEVIEPDNNDETSKALELVAKAAGFADFNELQAHIRENELKEKIESALAKREQDLIEDGYDEDIIKQQLEIDRRELQVQAREIQIAEALAEQQVAKVIKQFPLAPAGLVREFAVSAPKADLAAFAEKLHNTVKADRAKTIAQYATKKSGDAARTGVVRNAPNGSPAGATRPKPGATESDSWMKVLGF